MKEILCLLVFIVTGTELFAQNTQSQSVQPIASRQVSGIVVDSTEQAIRGAAVTLISQTDTLKTSTNEDGLFFFRNVKAWEFTLSVSSLGYRSFVKPGKYNYAAAQLTMDQIILRTTAQVLNEVTIKGSPSIIYKADTVEYRATDYIVREGAAVDDLLKKMEGMNVGRDGSLSYNGAPVPKARLNGKDFMGGNVATVIQTLPADIVEKIQIIDDYGDQAARTGIKDSDPSKLLNITTKADRSLGYIAKIEGGAGNDARYTGNVNGTRINANRNYTLAANISNTVNGVASDRSGGGDGPVQPSVSTGMDGSGGTTKKQGAGFTYRDQLSSKAQINMNYSYNLTTINSLNNSISQDFSTRGTTFSSNESRSDNNSGTHNFTLELENDLDSTDFLKITPVFSYVSTTDDNSSSALLSGLIRQSQAGVNSKLTAIPNYGLTIFYQHLFLKRGRNFSFQANASNRSNEQESEQSTNLVYYDQAGTVLKDSLVHRSIGRDNLTQNYRVSLTFSEPMNNAGSMIQFNGQINYNGYNNKALTSDLSQAGLPSPIDSLSNIFGYSFTQARLSFNYRYQKGKYVVSLGATGIPSILSGASSGPGTPIHSTSFNLIPLLRFNYSWSLQRNFSINYSGTATEPTFDQIQPVRDVTSPQNPVVGNPNLKISFDHSVNATYRSYSGNSRLGLNADLNTVFYDNRVITNIIQVADAYNSLKYEKHFLNINGAYRIGGNYTITKQLANRKYNFTQSGSISQQHYIGLSNNSRNISDQLILAGKFGLRMSPSERFDINPSVSYTYSKSDNSLAAAIDSRAHIISLSVNGSYYLTDTWSFGYDADKSFVNGINSNLTNNPFIVNAYFGKEFMKRSVNMRVQAFDLFNQNKFIGRNITETGITDTRSNSLSRYFMIRLTVNMQRWKGTPTRNDRPMQRRGDGSFIY